MRQRPRSWARSGAGDLVWKTASGALFALLSISPAVHGQEPTKAATPGRPGAGLPPWAESGPLPPLQLAEERSFTDKAQAVLTLEDAVVLALRQHPQITAAAASELAAQARVYQARSNWLPQINATASLSGSYSYNTATSPARELDQTRYNGQLGVSQLITDFTRTPARIEQARAGARAARGDLNAGKAQIALNAVTAYCAVLQYEAVYESTALNLAQQRQRVTQAESFLQIGTRPEIDVLTARTAAAQAELQLVQAQNNVLQGRVQLLVAIGVMDLTWLRRPLQPVAQRAVPEESPNGELTVELFEQALRSRPDVVALQERVLNAEQNLRAVRAQYYPQLSFNGSASVAGTLSGPSSTLVVGGAPVLDANRQPVQVFPNGAPSYSLNGSLVLNWSLFDGMQTPYQVREADAQLAQARANLEIARQQVRGTLQQAQFGVQTARQSLQAADAVLRQAELQRETAVGRYQAGVGNIIEVGDALASAATARAQRAQAEYNLAVVRASLQYQVGTLIPAGADQGSAQGAKAQEGVR